MLLTIESFEIVKILLVFHFHSLICHGMRILLLNKFELLEVELLPEEDDI